MENRQIAKLLGWTDIKEWGGRGVRGLRPGAERHESLPSYTMRLGDLASGIEAAGMGWGVRSVSRTEYLAWVDEWNEGTATLGRDDTPIGALLKALFEFKRRQP